MAELFRDNSPGLKDSQAIVLATILLAAIILQHTHLPVYPSYLTVLFVYVVIVLIFLLLTDATIETRGFYTALFLLFVILVFISTLLNANAVSFIRFVSLIVFTGATVFMLPKVIPLRIFLFVIARVSALLILMGFLPYLGFSIKLGYLDLTLWSATMYWYPSLQPITSVFRNPNTLGFLALVGSLAAFFEWYRHRTVVAGSLFFVNSVGLLFTNYRGGWIAYVVAMGAVIVYSLGGRKFLLATTISGLVGLVVLLLMIFSIVPGPERLATHQLNHRRQPWVAGVYALSDQPWWGHGLGMVTEAFQPYTAEDTGGIHNSYLRMFVALGLGGGLVYLVFILSTILGSMRHIEDSVSLAIPSFLLAFLFVQLFNNLAFIGISLHSVVIALFIGYYLTTSHKADIDEWLS